MICSRTGDERHGLLGVVTRIATAVAAGDVVSAARDRLSVAGNQVGETVSHVIAGHHLQLLRIR